MWVCMFVCLSPRQRCECVCLCERLKKALKGTTEKRPVSKPADRTHTLELPTKYLHWLDLCLNSCDTFSKPENTHTHFFFLILSLPPSLSLTHTHINILYTYYTQKHKSFFILLNTFGLCLVLDCSGFDLVSGVLMLNPAVGSVLSRDNQNKSDHPV